MWEFGIHCVDPCVDSGFARINFLAAADKTDDDSPVFMAIHAGNQKLWFRLREAGSFLFALHEIRGLPQSPGTLRLIKNGNMFSRRSGVNQDFITEMMYVLDERLNALSDFSLA